MGIKNANCRSYALWQFVEQSLVRFVNLKIFMNTRVYVGLQVEI